VCLPDLFFFNIPTKIGDQAKRLQFQPSSEGKSDQFDAAANICIHVISFKQMHRSLTTEIDNVSFNRSSELLLFSSSKSKGELCLSRD